MVQKQLSKQQAVDLLISVWKLDLSTASALLDATNGPLDVKAGKMYRRRGEKGNEWWEVTCNSQPDDPEIALQRREDAHFDKEAWIDGSPALRGYR